MVGRSHPADPQTSGGLVEEHEEDCCSRCKGSGVDPLEGWSEEAISRMLCTDSIPPPCQNCGGHGRVEDTCTVDYP